MGCNCGKSRTAPNGMGVDPSPAGADGADSESGDKPLIGRF